MNYLLDTHTLLWSLFEDEKLPAKVREKISDPNNGILISIVSYWEISLKYGIGKLELKGTTPEELTKAAREIGFVTLNVSEEDASTFYKLPKLKHKDPFDRLIIWQSINRQLKLISKDKAIREYKMFQRCQLSMSAVNTPCSWSQFSTLDSNPSALKYTGHKNRTLPSLSFNHRLTKAALATNDLASAKVGKFFSALFLISNTSAKAPSASFPSARTSTSMAVVSGACI